MNEAPFFDPRAEQVGVTVIETVVGLTLATIV